MHVTPFDAATFLVFAIASPLRAQGIEVFGGYSVNADYVQNRPPILVVDQTVSPFFSLGSGPDRVRGVRSKRCAERSRHQSRCIGYSDTFPPGRHRIEFDHVIFDTTDRSNMTDGKVLLVADPEQVSISDEVCVA